MLAQPLIWIGDPRPGRGRDREQRLRARRRRRCSTAWPAARAATTALAGRATWLLALAPAAFVLVMGYTEATTIALAVGMFLALRSKRWWVAAGLGVLVGLSRPSGFLLALPALIEAGRGLRGLPVKEYVGRAAAVLAPGGRDRSSTSPGCGTASATSGSRTRCRPSRPARLVREPDRHDRRRARTACSTATRSGPVCTSRGSSLVVGARRDLLPDLAGELRRARRRRRRQRDRLVEPRLVRALRPHRVPARPRGRRR